MNRLETYEYIIEQATQRLGDEYEAMGDVKGCEFRFEWQGDAFYQRLDATVTSETVNLKVSAFRDLNGSYYVDFRKKVGGVSLDDDELVEELVRVAIDYLVELSVEDLSVRRQRTGITTELIKSDEYMNEGWVVPYEEVENRALEGENKGEYTGP